MGSKTPPPEPDYTQERAEFAAAEAANRQQRANAYNRQVQGHNDLLRTNLNRVNDFGGRLDDLTIRDVDRFGSFEDELTGLQNQMNLMSFDTPAPEWSSSVQSPYGAVTVESPTLTQVDNRIKNSITSGLTDYAGDLSRLREDRTQEEGRVGAFRTGLLGELNNVNNQLENLSIRDVGQMNALSSTLGDINTRRSTFTSNILDQLYPGGFTTLQQRETQARSGLDDLRGRRQTELDRISGYRDNLRSGYDTLDDQFSGLTIADEQGITDLQRAIDQRQLDASRFDSELDFDFTNSLNNYQSLEDRLSGLRSDRQAELRRIQMSQDAARQAAMNLEDTLDTVDMYDLGRLNSLKRQTREGLNDLNDFTSELDFDFGNEVERLTGAQSAIDQLLAQRQNTLSGYDTQIDDLLSGVNSANLYEEDAFNSALSDLQSLQGNLGRFSGMDAQQIGFDLESALNATRGRLDDLADYRTGIESDLQSELEALSGTPFYDVSDFNQYDARASELQALIDQYGATSATDELAQYRDRLATERARLQNDLLASSTPTQAATQTAEQLLQGVSNGSLSPEEYLALLAGIEEEEELSNLRSGFSGNILRL